ncbi:MAG: hypothetical protein J6J23_02240 [Clostridia bacterium]|nr:hypothetical protein [Clostridia bacterium]
MASFSIHLAVAKRYLDKWQINDEMAFYKGAIAPDFTDDKRKAHYSGTYTDELKNNLANKVRLNEYLKTNVVDSEYKIGVFLHLVTDYLFFNSFFDEETINRFGFKEFFRNMYYSYDLVGEEIIEKYEIGDVIESMPELQANIEVRRKQELSTTVGLENLLPMDKLDKFIEYVSSIDLAHYINCIAEADMNVMPE